MNVSRPNLPEGAGAVDGVAHAGPEQRDVVAERDVAVRAFRAKLAQWRTAGPRAAETWSQYLRALDAATVSDLTHLDLVSIARTQRRPIVQADSFWHCIARRQRMKQLGPVPEKLLGRDKDLDLDFARGVGVRTVENVARSRWDAIETGGGDVVVKPVKGSGSKGAFYVRRGSILSIKERTVVADWSAARSMAMRQLGIADIDATDWVVQPLVLRRGEPAVDMKFYSFYGQIGLIQEVHRYPRVQYEFFNEDFTVAKCGRDHEPRFDDPSETTVDKGALDEARLDTVRRLSAAIPAPFARIDFLNADDGLVFCEFSLAPGMSHSLTRSYDRRLGKMYLNAERRLTEDLLAGKPFVAYRGFVDRHGDSRLAT